MTLTKVNLASGQTRFGHGWLNVDVVRPAPELEHLVNVRADLLEGIPFHDMSVDILYCSHFLEHLHPFEECETFLRECWRVLRPRGVIRTAVPDFRRIATLYLEDPKSFYAEYGFTKPWFAKAQTWNRRLGISVMYDHKMLYDLVSLSEVLKDAGFVQIVEVGTDMLGGLPAGVIAEIVPTHLSHSLVVDALKPS